MFNNESKVKGSNLGDGVVLVLKRGNNCMASLFALLLGEKHNL